MTLVLTLDDATRFERSRKVGPYLGDATEATGLGESEPQLRITKEGDGYLRSLLIQAAHCILRQNAPEKGKKKCFIGAGLLIRP
jgi:transposase